jgi:hypothetical protein
LWKKLDKEKAKNVMQLFAQYGQKNLTSKQLAQHIQTETERASGIMPGITGIMSSINKGSEEIGFSWKYWFPLKNKIYETNEVAYANLVEAIRLVNN